MLLDHFCDDEAGAHTIASWAMEGAIGIACNKGYMGIIQCLLEHGYSKYVRPNHFHDAQHGGHEDIAGLLRPILARRQPEHDPDRLQHPANQFLDDYQMQLKLLEYQNQKRTWMARQQTSELHGYS